MKHSNGASRALLHRALLHLPPETAHNVVLALLQVVEGTPFGDGFLRRSLAPKVDRRLEQNLLGLRFSNPIGLAAGFDKDGKAVAGMAALGFGWIEVGTVTPRPQRGNPRPRLFRHVEAESLENRMGFNNAGQSRLRRRLARAYPAAVPLGVNIGKNRDTPNDRAQEDYLSLVEALGGLCDYLVVNISSPNTPGLRDLQIRGFLEGLIRAARGVTDKPLMVKLSPDLEVTEAIDLARGAVEAGAAGLVLTNTTTDSWLLPSSGGGGLSGRVLKEKSFAMLKGIATELYGDCLLVSVGGIDSGREVYRRLRAGASLVQVYTALVYRGPSLVRRIAAELTELLDRDGLGSVAEAVGLDCRESALKGRMP
jgi:dihydroorotate dehydrogenase